MDTKNWHDDELVELPYFKLFFFMDTSYIDQNSHQVYMNEAVFKKSQEAVRCLDRLVCITYDLKSWLEEWTVLSHGI